MLGFQSVVTLIPSKNIGIAIEINSEDGEIVLGLMYELLDHYLGFSRNDWPEKYSDFKQQRLAGALKALDAPAAKPAQGWTFTAAGALRRHLCGPVVREHRAGHSRRCTDHRFQTYAAHGGGRCSTGSTTRSSRDSTTRRSSRPT